MFRISIHSLPFIYGGSFINIIISFLSASSCVEWKRKFKRDTTSHLRAKQFSNIQMKTNSNEGICIIRGLFKYECKWLHIFLHIYATTKCHTFLERTICRL